MASKKSGIQRAVEQVEGSSALAAFIGNGVSRQNIDYWVSLGHVPVDKCPMVSIATGIPVEELNPLHDWTVVRRALDLKAV